MLRFFHVFVVVNSVSMDIGVHMTFLVIVLSGYMPRNETAGSYGYSTFSLWRNCHTVFHNGCNNLHSHYSVRGLLLLHALSSIYYFVDFLMVGILTHVR